MSARNRYRPNPPDHRPEQYPVGVITEVSPGVPAGASRRRENRAGLPADAGVVSGP